MSMLSLSVLSSFNEPASSANISVIGHALCDMPSLNGRTMLRSAKVVVQVCLSRQSPNPCLYPHDKHTSMRET